jgi:hypothetical protein
LAGVADETALQLMDRPMRQERRLPLQVARTRAIRRRAHEGHHHMPLPLRIAGLLISIALSLTACDTLAGVFNSSRWNMVGFVLLVVVVAIFVFQRMRKP